MSISWDQAIPTLLALLGNAAVVAYAFGRLAERVGALREQLAAQGQRFDLDLNRLNGKVENDVHGRRAVAQLQTDVATINATVGHIQKAVDGLSARFERRVDA